MSIRRMLAPNCNILMKIFQFETIVCQPDTMFFDITDIGYPTDKGELALLAHKKWVGATIGVCIKTCKLLDIILSFSTWYEIHWFFSSPFFSNWCNKKKKLYRYTVPLPTPRCHYWTATLLTFPSLSYPQFSIPYISKVFQNDTSLRQHPLSFPVPLCIAWLTCSP